MRPFSVEDAIFIKNFLNSPDFKRFCKFYFEVRTEALKSLCTVKYQSPSFSMEMSHWQGVLVGMDKMFRLLEEAEILISKSEKEKIEKTPTE